LETNSPSYIGREVFFMPLDLFPFSTFPYIPRKASLRQKRFTTESLGHNFKASVFHSTCPYIPEKYRETVKLHSNLHLQSQVRFKSCIMRINSFLNPFSTFPCISPKATFRKKSFTTHILDTIPNFSFPFR